MSNTFEVIRHKPIAHWTMDDNSPFTDYSGYGRVASSTSQPIQHLSLAYGAQYASIFNRDNTATFDAPVYVQGKEADPFTISSWIRPVKKSDYLVQPYQENLLTNPIPTTTTNWYTSNFGTGAGTMTYDATTQSNVGTITTASTNSTFTMRIGNTSFGTASSRPPVVPGGIYYQRVELMSTVDDVRSMAIDFNDGNGTIGGDSILGIVLPANTWVVAEMWGTADEGSVSASTNVIYTHVNSVIRPVGSKLHMRRAVFARVPDTNTRVPYFDGSMAGYEWSGTANASVSRTRTDVAKHNLAPRPRVSIGGSPLSNNTFWTNAYNVTLPTPTPDGITTGYSSTVNSISANVTSLTTYNTDGLGNWPVTRYIGYWVMTPNSNYMATQIINGVTTTVDLNPNEWKWINVETNGWAPATIRKVVGQGNAAIGDIAYLTGVTVSLDVPPTEFFDGNSSGAAWTGTVNNSASVMYLADGPQQILSKNNHDGLSINGSVVSFAVSYLTTGEARAEYDIGDLQNAFVVGVYNVNAVQLWVNGEMVAETETTEGQRNDAFLSVANTFGHGGSYSGRTVAVNGVSVFDYALSGPAIRKIYASGTKTYERQGTANVYGGEILDTAATQTDVFASQTWDTAEDWAFGINNNTVVVDDELVPSVQDGALQTGSWQDNFIIDAGKTSIYAVVPDWEGEGVTVEASLDGVTWTALERGKGTTLIPSGFDPTGKVLQVMVTFTDVAGYMESLTLKGYSTGVTTIPNGRTFTLSSAYPHKELDINALSDDWGILSVDGSVTISNAGIDTGTYEVWIQKTTDETPSMSPVGTTYINGSAAGLGNLRKGEWAIVHRTKTPAAVDLTISGDFRIGRTVFYPTEFNAATVQEIYNSYVGTNIVRADDISVIGVTEPATASTIYAHDWTILTSG